MREEAQLNQLAKRKGMELSTLDMVELVVLTSASETEEICNRTVALSPLRRSGSQTPLRALEVSSMEALARYGSEPEILLLSKQRDSW